LQRLAESREIDSIVVATSTDAGNLPLVQHVQSLGFACEQGSENDVLARYLQAASKHQAGIVVRITGDCPLVDPALVDQCIRKFRNTEVDYLSNTVRPTFPDGLDVEVFKMEALQQAAQEARNPEDREHVTPFLRKSGKFSLGALENEEDLSGLRWTVDDPEDLEVVRAVFGHFAPDENFSWKQVLALFRSHPELFCSNSHLGRNEGELLGTGQKLWKRAKRVIPGGNMLLSKRAEMFLPDGWPTYFSRAKGCHVWDLDGKEYIDMSIMGVGTNILGYGHPEVDAAVQEAIRRGNMSTLNCPEEVTLAEKLIELHPWAEMVRLARSGGEANAIAIRIARAATGKERVAVCGYHGWHDWYLSANLADDQNLDGHLLPGLEPRGVPRNLKGTVFPFRYNHYEELENLVKQEGIGIVKMEVERNEPPQPGYLQKIRKLCSERGIVLIFDECTSGFRETFGGLHKKYGVEPDMAMFGKALGNGYAITAVIGRRALMEAAQTTFISSTFWTERIGPTAALKCLEVMEREKSWEKIPAIGTKTRALWGRLSCSYGVPIQISGMPALGSFSFLQPSHALAKTFLTQELLKDGFLASTAFYACLVHDAEVLEKYGESLEKVFARLAQISNERDLQAELRGPVCHTGFKRLN